MDTTGTTSYNQQMFAHTTSYKSSTVLHTNGQGIYKSNNRSKTLASRTVEGPYGGTTVSGGKTYSLYHTDKPTYYQYTSLSLTYISSSYYTYTSRTTDSYYYQPYQTTSSYRTYTDDRATYYHKYHLRTSESGYKRTYSVTSQVPTNTTESYNYGYVTSNTTTNTTIKSTTWR